MYNWFIYHKRTKVISKCKNIKQYLEITGTTRGAYEIVETYLGLEFIKTEHVKELDSYGFKMNVDGKNIVYTGDTCSLEPYIPFLNNCNELYVDVSKYGGVHLKFEDIIEKLKEIKKNCTNVFLMHIDDKEYITKINNDEFNV